MSLQLALKIYKKIFLKAKTRVSESGLGPRASWRLHIVTVLEDRFNVQKKTTFLKFWKVVQRQLVSAKNVHQHSWNDVVLCKKSSQKFSNTIKKTQEAKHLQKK